MSARVLYVLDFRLRQDYPLQINTFQDQQTQPSIFPAKFYNVQRTICGKEQPMKL